MKFEKYHALENDFIIIKNKNNISYPFLARKLCSRKSGIGADGLIVIKGRKNFQMRIFNMDGSEASMCGNGIRCLAYYLYLHQKINKDEFEVKTKAGIINLRILGKHSFLVKVDLGVPSFSLSQIKGRKGEEYFPHLFCVENKSYLTYSLFVGTIHTIIFVNRFDDKIIESVGKEIAYNPLFKDGTNVDFVQINNAKKIEVRTYEKGVGRTSACGTGCAASFFCAYKLGLVKEECIVQTEKGNLFISFNHKIYMTGSAEKVFEGSI